MMKRVRGAPLSRRRPKSLRELLPHAVIVTDPKILARLKAEAARRKQMAAAPGNRARSGSRFNVHSGLRRLSQASERNSVTEYDRPAQSQGNSFGTLCRSALKRKGADFRPLFLRTDRLTGLFYVDGFAVRVERAVDANLLAFVRLDQVLAVNVKRRPAGIL